MQTATKPMAKNSQVYTTLDYSIFKSIDGNRDKNSLHVRRLKESMEKKYLFTVIIVNELFQIIDGQHRFDVIQELNLPLNYIICEGYGLDEVHVLNQNSKNWNAEDFLNGYADLNIYDYVEYRKFKLKYELGHNECRMLLTSSFDKQTVNFNDGSFKVTSIKKAYNTAEKIMTIGKFYAGFKRRSFVTAIFNLLSNENFDFDTLIRKLEIQPSALKDCTSTSQYIDLIEVIYNYRNRNKVSLKY
jgi:hypothetical protein